jgi:hypothetical protein
VAVDPRWRHQSGEAVEQLERGEDQHATGAGAWFGVVVQEAFGFESIHNHSACARIARGL